MSPGRADPDVDHDADEAAADDPEGSDEEYDHLRSLDDGAGCTEIWAHLSERRDE
jgi:hypothetical protein